MADDAGSAADLAATVGASLDRLAPPGPLGVAVSGGGDSMALLAIATGWAARRRRPLTAVTVDHGLRPGSAGEAAFVAGHCARTGVPHRVLTAGPMPPGNLAAAAREARYALMAGWARENRVAAVALGHTMDDQAETMLMRLARGSGAEGLSGMAPRRDWAGVAWIRPMLGVRRSALRDWLREQGIAWVEDPTNEDPDYDRVKARQALAVLEPLGITVDGLAATARMLSRQRRVLARAAAETAARVVRRGAFGEARLDLAALRETERDTALRVFADTLAGVAGRRCRPRFRSLEPALSALLAGEPATLGGCLVMRSPDAGAALICREPAAVGPPVALAAGVVWDRRWRIMADTAPPGLRVGAVGTAGLDHLGRAAREGRWLPPRRWSSAPRQVRATVPAIYASDGSVPLAVPPAGYLADGASPELRAIRAEPVWLSEDAAG